MNQHGVVVLCMLWLGSAAAQAMTIDYASVFPTVVQGVTANLNSSCSSSNASTLEITNSSRIKGGSSPSLNLCRINVQSNNGNCINSAGSLVKCTANGSQISPLVLDAFATSSNTNSVTYNNGQVVTLGASGLSEYGNLVVDNATLKFSNLNTTYKIKSLTVRNGQAAVYLAPGDYWIETLDLDGRKLLLSETGTTRIFVKNYLSVKNQATLNEDNTGSLVVIGYGSIELLGGTHNGYFYADDNFIVRNQGTVNGRVTARDIYVYDSYIYDTSTVLPPVLGCVSDDFNVTSLSNDWVVAKSSGTFTPKIVNGRLRLTEAVTYQATSISYQRLFPAADNLVTIEFDQAAYGGNGADGIAMVLSDASVTPQPGSSGGPLGYGYKTGSPGFAGGWLGVGIDEYGNFRAEGGSNNQTRKANTVSIRGSGSNYSGYRYLYGTDTLSPAVHNGSSYPTPAHRYRLRVDSRTSGQALVLIERNTGSGYVTLIPQFNAIGQTGQSAIPENFYLSFTGSTGGSNNIHELDNVKICALKSSTVGTQIDHFEFDFAGNPLTCTPQTMTIRACANAACSSLVTESVTATLAPSSLADGSWTGGNVVTFSGGSSTLTLAKRTAGNVTIGVTGSTPATKPLSTTLCRNGSSGSLSAAACTLNFADSGFIFDVPAKRANQPATGISIQAVRTSDSLGLCVPAFAGVTRNVAFWSSYVSPATTVNSAKPAVTVNSTAVGFTEATATSIPLVFDAKGTATLSVNYADAGEMRLDARYTGTAANGDANLVMNGYDQFVSAPVGLCIEPEQTCSAGNASCPAFRRAGETFALKITPRAWQQNNDTDLCSGNLITPNFALSGIALGSQLVAPASGVNATVTQTSYDHSALASGTATLNQAVSEVGVFRMTATPPSYMGMSLPVATSGPVGRFTPYDYQIQNPSLQAACFANGFSYMDQPFAIGYQAIARNKSGQTTLNYDSRFDSGGFVHDVTTLVAENNDDGVPLDARLSSVSASWVQGMQSVSSYPVAFSRLASGGADGPFARLDVGVKLLGNDSLSVDVSNGDMHSATSGSCSSCNAVKLGTQMMRLGRLSAGNGRTSPASGLALPLQFEYFNGSNWVLNTMDNCSRLDLQASDGFVFDRGYDLASRELTLASNAHSRLSLSSSRSVAGTAASQTANGGYIWLHFSAPNVNDRVNYQIELSKQPSTPVWLRFDWDGDGSAGTAEASGWAYFNQWRGSDRIIYRREQS